MVMNDTSNEMQKFVTIVLGLSAVLAALVPAVSLEQDTQRKNNSNTRSSTHPCFCELTGTIDDCTCKVESVSSFNDLQINPRLRSLLERDYFKFYRVNLKKVCPFWADDGSCAFESCSVCPCPEEDIPCGLKEEDKESSSKYSAKENGKSEEQDCDDRSNEEIRLSALDTTISKKDQEAFETWQEHDDAQMDFCEPQDEVSADMQYVDLTINPERYTGYKGASPRRIWNSIYKENCFAPDPEITGYESLASQSFVKGLCLEKRAFYRLISGLHSSINIHLCAKYLLNEGKLGKEMWGYNVEEFTRRFHPDSTEGEGPIRLKNLFFTYLIVLRAIDKAAPSLANEKFYSGMPEEDSDVRAAVMSLLKIIRKFPNHFNESAMFQGDAQQLMGKILVPRPGVWRPSLRTFSRFYRLIIPQSMCGNGEVDLLHYASTYGESNNMALMYYQCHVTDENQNLNISREFPNQRKEEFRTHFRNISRIMDCVGCDKCKLWGKLQVQGLGTALKILFTPENIPLKLKRQEIVSLFNGFGRLSSSVKALSEFEALIEGGGKVDKTAGANGYF